MHFNTLFFKAYVTLNYKLNKYLRLRLIIAWKRSRCAERKKYNPKKTKSTCSATGACISRWVKPE